MELLEELDRDGPEVAEVVPEEDEEEEELPEGGLGFNPFGMLLGVIALGGGVA